jgi:MauM/NapG family ferredoxin protein
MKLKPSRVSQILFLAFFLLLFVTTDYRGRDEISVAMNAFFRMDPLVAASHLLSAKTFVILLLPGLFVLLFSLVLGRFFCGWICPLGTVIDLVTGRIRKSRPLLFLRGRLKYYVLFTILFAALFNMNLAGILDPIAILVRFLTFAFYPLFGFLAKSGWVGLYRVMGDARDYLEPGYGFLKTYILPFRDTFYPLALVSLLFFGGILLLERFERRNWCRNLCPAGALLGLLGRFAPFRRMPPRLCSDCGTCAERCPTAFEGDAYAKEGCILCMDCVRGCAQGRARFSFRLRPRSGKAGARTFEPGRRVFVTGLLSGLFFSRMVGRRTAPQNETGLLRPPGVGSEGAFLERCVRCGECMKVCLRSALYPASLQAGLYGLYTPMLVPRLGYCEYNCSLCGQVCPTGAIPKLPIEEKKKAVIGIAVVDKNHCLPHAKKMNCMVCEEHCPIPDKAIRFETVRESGYDGREIVLKKPYVVDGACTGCGICEYVCPLEEKAGIEVFKKTKRKV